MTEFLRIDNNTAPNIIYQLEYIKKNSRHTTQTDLFYIKNISPNYIMLLLSENVLMFHGNSVKYYR